MSPVIAWGLVLGLTLGLGLLLIVSVQPLGWRPTLEQRVEPQLRHHVPASRLLDEEAASASPWGAWGRLLEGPLAAVAGWLQRFSPAGDALVAKLDAAGSDLSPADYRAQQTLLTCGGAAVGMGLAVLLLATGSAPVITGLALVLALAMAGFILRDQLLALRITRRRAAILTEFPSVAELFALAVGAGESASAALERIATTARGELAGEFGRALADMRAGTSLAGALKVMSRRLELPPVERFVAGVLIAIDRGTPLADVLRAQAQDVREMGRRELMEAAGRKEIQMMVPLVFGILPLTVVFAVFPGISLLKLGF
ncbi:type II secretion system F family protein [Micrococcus sp.]|uniref:type II secretion system F family protein n=1 Tax=Micrococcus sp. TaxID=1271 RepID=UPI002A912C70|nr:type II secretion system F family protein [Micrococcus sp.]MDY6055087.1 type II secretion system F family protein [Micrococcus sp.]